MEWETVGEGVSSWTGRRKAGLKVVRLPTVTRFGNPGEEKDFLVEPEHEEELRAFVLYANKHARLFMGLVSILSVACLVGAFLLKDRPEMRWVLGATIALLGATIWIFPFATPETTAMLGLRASRTLARASAVITALMGLGMIFVF